ISTRWPTALVTTYFSLSKYSSNFSNLPAVGVSARTMSCATDGFSAITKVFVIVFSLIFEFCGGLCQALLLLEPGPLLQSLFAGLRLHQGNCAHLSTLFKLTEF